MTRPTRKMLAISGACAVVLGVAGGVAGHAAGSEPAPGLVVEPVVVVQRPQVGDALQVPIPVSIPKKAPK